MFDEISAVVKDLRQHVDIVKRNAILGGNFFHALALAVAYNNLIQLADERTREHPEVQRVPSLRYILLEHFYNNADRHIDIRKGTIFDDSLLGGIRSLREWQEAGYHTRRSTANYDKRLRYWKAIYDGAPLAFQQRVVDNTEIFSNGSVYQSTFIAPLSKSEKKSKSLSSKLTGVEIPGRVQRNGRDVTYEDVILSRDTRYNATQQLVPWWYALNYGTGGKGYPQSAGLFFVEDAEREVPVIIDRYAQLFSQFISDIFLDESLTRDSILTVESWVRTHINLGPEYIPSLDLARIKAFGVPF